jgi:hypothetical protein
VGRRVIRIALACSCGVVVRTDVHEATSNAVQKAWDIAHRGPGHSPADPDAVNAAAIIRHDFVRQMETGAFE